MIKFPARLLVVLAASLVGFSCGSTIPCSLDAGPGPNANCCQTLGGTCKTNGDCCSGVCNQGQCFNRV